MGFEGLGATAALGQSFVSLAGGIQQSLATRARSEFQANQLNFNAQLSELFAADAIARGNEKITDFASGVRQLKGAQRAAAAAQGIDVGSGSAQEIAADTAQTANEAAIRLRNNAWREAWGYKVQAQDRRFQAELTQLAGDFTASQTLLGGALQAGQFGLQAFDLGAKALENAFKNRQNTRGSIPGPITAPPTRIQELDPFDLAFGERPAIQGAFGFDPEIIL